MAKINLDALIAREDFEIQDAINSGKKKETISIEDLQPDAFFYTNIRKPDFQRETNEWGAEKIAEFIESFLDGDLIPAIILWRSPAAYVFVIDGSHRLSSLAAWINDDYGDGRTSKMFYDGRIPDEQMDLANKARSLVNRKIGSYSDFKLALTNPEKVRAETIQRTKNLSALAIQLQWVEGDATKAENSFFKINQQAAPINKTELALLESRRKPNCIAARAIIRSGKGHKYWANFSSVNQVKVQTLAEEINKILFSPPLKTPVKTLDIPIGGKISSAQTLSLVLDFINIANGISQDFKESLSDDNSGEVTIEHLMKARKVARIINSIHPSSLGLHPIIYLYSQEGRHKAASFLATIAFVLQLEKSKKLKRFIAVRQSFEEFLQKYDYVIQQIVRKYRGAYDSHSHIKDFYFTVIEELNKVLDVEQVFITLSKVEKYSYLSFQPLKNITSDKDFDTGRKSAVYIKEAINTAPRCSICKGYIHSNSITIDHIKRREDGGTGAIENGQLAHPYCNSTIKN